MKMHEAHAGHIARVLGKDTLLVQIDSVMIDRYFEQRDEEGAKLTTQGKELSTIRGTLRLAARNKQFHLSLESVLPHGFEVNYVPLETHLTLPEVDRLLRVLEPARAAVCAFIVATAADWKSVHAAKRIDVDLKHGMVLVRGSKNPARRRTIPILATFRPLLELAVKHMPFQPWDNVRRDLAVACRRARVTKVTPRDLRRSHASILRGIGIEPHLLSKMLGHVDSRMVERVYGQLPPDMLSALMSSRLDEAPIAKDPKPKAPRKPSKRRRAA
jgi:integrase